MPDAAQEVFGGSGAGGIQAARAGLLSVSGNHEVPKVGQALRLNG